jgi:hypothetical protein
MCRNIKTLHHFEPPATPEEMRASALQYVRKLSGMRMPSRSNRAAFESAIEDIYSATVRLLASLEAHGPPRTREAERLKAVERGRRREERLRAELGAHPRPRTSGAQAPSAARMRSKRNSRSSTTR